MNRFLLRKAIEYIVNQCGPIEGRHLINLIYLADREWHQKHGKTYTEAHFYRWNHGPFSREILQEIEWMDGVEIIEREHSYDMGQKIFHYSSGSRTRLYGVQLDKKFINILDDIADKWGKEPLKKLLDFVYRRKDFKKSEFGDRLLFC